MILQTLILQTKIQKKHSAPRQYTQGDIFCPGATFKGLNPLAIFMQGKFIYCEFEKNILDGG